jgi:hypothetical protein
VILFDPLFSSPPFRGRIRIFSVKKFDALHSPEGIETVSKEPFILREK